MKIVKVLLKKSTKEFDSEYSYISGDEYDNLIYEGCMVLIPFGKANRKTEAFINKIINIEDYDGEYPVESLKYILEVPENGNKDLSDEFLNMTAWMSKKYFCSRSAAIKCMMPPGEEKISDKKVKTVKLALDGDRLKEAIQGGSLKKIYQIDILNYLEECKECPVEEILKRFSVSVSVLNTLKKHNYIEYGEKIKEVSGKRENEKIKYYAPPKELTKEQENAVDILKARIDTGGFSEYLLHGVTGSGKTEVYLNIIQEVISKGKNAIVLVPEISLTPQMTDRFKGRFGENVTVIHSRLTSRERYDRWQLIKTGKVKLAVGVRSAVFAPFENLGVIIIDEEHDGSYKSDVTPRYHTAEVAEYRCRYNNALLLYGSATPSIDLSYRVQKKSVGYIKLSYRASGVNMPAVTLVDMKQEYESGNRGVFSGLFLEELEKNLNNKEQSLILLNKRGFSSAVICPECGYVQKCPSCNMAMTYHLSNERGICHYCGYTEPAVKICPNCGSKDLRQPGIGTQRAEAELKNIFPGISVVRMDMDTTKGKNSHEEIIRRFSEGKADVMLGTQMIAKGHDFKNVSLAGIIAADAALNFDDYRASERTFQLIMQASGRAGRADKRGRVIIQARNVDDYAVVSAANQDYRNFYKQEIKIRKALNLPPFTNLAVLGLKGKNDKYIYDILSELKNKLGKEVDTSRNIQILGPARYPIEKINGNYRWRLIIKCPEEKYLNDVCTKIFQIVNFKKYREITGPFIDINPINML